MAYSIRTKYIGDRRRIFGGSHMMENKIVGLFLVFGLLSSFDLGDVKTG
jgi:hypothetical protein